MIAKATLITGLTMASAALAPGDHIQSRRLTSIEIRTALSGTIVGYEPPGTADARVHEEFHEDGRWAGMLYGRGPEPFSGRWRVSNDQLCVLAENGLERWKRGWFCRVVWREDRSSRILIKHIAYDVGPLVLTVRPLSN